MGLRKATDAEVFKHFMLNDAVRNLQLAMDGGLDRLRDQMGLVMDLDEVHPDYKKCGVCKSPEIKYYPGGYQDPGSYGCLECGASYDEGNPEEGWRKPVLDLEVWDLLEKSVEALTQDDPLGIRIEEFLDRHRKPAGSHCWDCKTPVPASDDKYSSTCKACEIKWNRVELEKRHGS